MPSLKHKPPAPMARALRKLGVLVSLFSSFLSLSAAATAEEAAIAGSAPQPVMDEAFFGLGGAYIAGYFNDMIWHPLGNDYFGDLLLGFGYQKFFFVDPNGISLGAEIGAGARWGVSAPSAELWTGGVVRYGGIKLFDKLRVSPAVTVGFSYVTGTTLPEAERETGSGDSAGLLFYLGPEINLSLVDKPEWEMFARIQHRSGLYGTLADIDGANALSVGLRHRF